MEPIPWHIHLILIEFDLDYCNDVLDSNEPLKNAKKKNGKNNSWNTREKKINFTSKNNYH